MFKIINGCKNQSIIQVNSRTKQLDGTWLSWKPNKVQFNVRNDQTIIGGDLDRAVTAAAAAALMQYKFS